MAIVKEIKVDVDNSLVLNDIVRNAQLSANVKQVANLIEEELRQKNICKKSNEIEISKKYGIDVGDLTFIIASIIQLKP
jgi:hypothetical protein